MSGIWIWRFLAVMALALLQGCGGGGGGGGGVANDWLKFYPSPVTASLMEGESEDLLIVAESSRTISSALYVKVIDAAGVTTGYVDLAQYTSTSYLATLKVSPSLPPGTHTGNLEVWLYTDQAMTQVYEGSPWRVPYEITVGARRTVHRLLADRLALGFSSFPSQSPSRLSGTIKISDNLGKRTAWRASSSQEWLTVTRSGETAAGSDELTMVVDPSSLPAEVTSFATVTVSSPDTSVTNKQVIRVGVWKSGSDPTPRVLELTSYNTAADPAAPLIYSNAHGSTVDVLHAYRGVVVARMDAGPGVTLGAMTVSADGRRLFAYDTTGNSVIVFDLLKRTRIAAWPAPGYGYPYKRIGHLRPNGVEVLAVGSDFMSASDGANLGVSLGVGATRLITSPSGDSMYTSDSLSSTTLYKWTLDFIDHQGIGLEVKKVLERWERFDRFAIGRFEPLAISPDGLQLYAYVSRINTADFSLLGEVPGLDMQSSISDPTLAWVTAGSDGRLYVTYRGDTTLVMDSEGRQLRRLTSTSSWAQPIVTGDGIVFMTASGNQFEQPDRVRLDPVLP